MCESIPQDRAAMLPIPAQFLEIFTHTPARYRRNHPLYKLVSPSQNRASHSRLSLAQSKYRQVDKITVQKIAPRF
jgi:hypothetical protein